MADTRFKIENGLLVTGAGSNTLFEQRVTVSANLTVSGDLLYVGGNLYVQGNSVIVGTSVYDVDITPLTDNSRSVGNSTNRFIGFFSDLTVGGSLRPSSNGLLLGNTTRRWDASTTNINASGVVTVGNSVIITGNTDITGRITVTNASSFGNTTITGFVNASSSANVGGSLTVGGTATISGNATAQNIILNGVAIFANTQTAVGITQKAVDGFPTTLGKFAQAYIAVTTGVLYHSTNINIIQDGAAVLITHTNELFNTSLGSFTSDINGANVDIYFTGANSAATYTVKTIRQQIL